MKVYCATGYELNLPKRKIRCKRGEWKPGNPVCRPVSCSLPSFPKGSGSGHFNINAKARGSCPDYTIWAGHHGRGRAGGGTGKPTFGRGSHFDASR